MKPGLQGNTGHFVELRTCKDKNWRDKHWDSEQKKFIDDGPAKFFYCSLCNQYAWGWSNVCPNKTIKVERQITVFV
jgi:hypothetical protein